MGAAASTQKPESRHLRAPQPPACARPAVARGTAGIRGRGRPTGLRPKKVGAEPTPAIPRRAAGSPNATPADTSQNPPVDSMGARPHSGPELLLCSSTAWVNLAPERAGAFQGDSSAIGSFQNKIPLLMGKNTVILAPTSRNVQLHTHYCVYKGPVFNTLFDTLLVCLWTHDTDTVPLGNKIKVAKTAKLPRPLPSPPPHPKSRPPFLRHSKNLKTPQ